MEVRYFDYARKMCDGKPVVEGNGDERKEVRAYPNAHLPEYQTRNSAGADFFSAETVTIPSVWKSIKRLCEAGVVSKETLKSCVENEELIKGYFKPVHVHTGIKACMCDDEVLELYNRSSNPVKLGLVLSNSVGVVDSDYFENKENDGEISFAFYNFSYEDVTIHEGDRIGQGVFKKFLRPTTNIRVRDEERVGGYGSTGR